MAGVKVLMNRPLDPAKFKTASTSAISSSTGNRSLFVVLRNTNCSPFRSCEKEFRSFKTNVSTFSSFEITQQVTRLSSLNLLFSRSFGTVYV